MITNQSGNRNEPAPTARLIPAQPGLPGRTAPQQGTVARRPPALSPSSHTARAEPAGPLRCQRSQQLPGCPGAGSSGAPPPQPGPGTAIAASHARPRPFIGSAPPHPALHRPPAPPRPAHRWYGGADWPRRRRPFVWGAAIGGARPPNGRPLASASLAVSMAPPATEQRRA